MKIKYSVKEKREKRHFDVMAKVYDSNYGYFDSFTKYKIAKKVDFFVKQILKNTKNNNHTMLELGCGTGMYTELVSNLLPKSKIIALDVSPGMIIVAKNKCKKNKNIKFLTKSAYSTGLRSNSLDVVFGFYVLHHLDIKKTKKEIYRILKPGGLAFFCEPNILNPIVYVIKKFKYIKNMVGDSPDEWAINPITISKQMKPLLKINVGTSEYVLPLKSNDATKLILLDKITNYIFSRIPIINMFGGSVTLVFRKDNAK